MVVIEKSDTGFSAYSEAYPVYTTGATIKSAARVLLSYEPQSITAVVACRAVQRLSGFFYVELFVAYVIIDVRIVTNSFFFIIWGDNMKRFLLCLVFVMSIPASGMATKNPNIGYKRGPVDTVLDMVNIDTYVNLVYEDFNNKNQILMELRIKLIFLLSDVSI